MAKPNVHTASRDELVEAGVRAELADEILKRRRKGAIRLEALEEVPGVGPATLEQLRQVLDFREQQAASGNGGRANEQWAQADERARAREGGGSDERRPREEGPPARTAEAAAAATNSAARLGVKVARDTTAAGAEATAEAARSGLQVVRRSADAVGEATRRSAEGTAELGQVLAELVQEQTRRNLETWTALAGAVDWHQMANAVDWERVFQIQREHLQVSLERTAELTRRSLEITQAVMTAAASASSQQARKAA